MCAEVKIDVALVTEKLLANGSARNFGCRHRTNIRKLKCYNLVG